MPSERVVFVSAPELLPARRGRAGGPGRSLSDWPSQAWKPTCCGVCVLLGGGGGGRRPGGRWLLGGWGAHGSGEPSVFPLTVLIMKHSLAVTQRLLTFQSAVAAHTTIFFFFFKGEIVVNEVNFVRKCIATDTSQYDLWGKLICTNFKISFVTDDPMPLQVRLSACCLLLSRLLGLRGS